MRIYNTRCPLCGDKVEVKINEADVESCESIGLDIGRMMKNGAVCEECDFHRKTGYRKPKNPILTL